MRVLKENEIAKAIVNAAFRIHTKLGPGLLESVYEAILAQELRNHRFAVETQKAMPVVWDGAKLDIGFRADLIVDNLVIVEVKSVEEIHPVHKMQLLTYLRVAQKRLGLLINFGERLIKDGITRVANKLY